jgi:N-acyl amino acid synthase of PEP-CTERM/exosortase system
MFLFELLNLSHGFRKYFDVAPAVTPALQAEAYAIRHRVYCEELGYEPVRPDRRESDPYDSRADHVLVRSIQVNRFVACARVVRVDPADPESELPMERSCAAAIDRSIVDPKRVDRARIGEISRLAIVPEFRKRRGEKNTAIAVSEADFGSVDLPRFPYIQVALYYGSIALAKRLGIETIFTLTEPRLAAHFAKLGARPRPIGTAIEHRGQRVPSVLTVSETEANLPRSIRPLYDLLCDAIWTGFESRTRTVH